MLEPRELSALRLPGLQCLSVRLLPELSAGLRQNPEWVKQAHDLGLEVNVWTIDKSEDMRYFIDLGVDYITTDYPELLQQQLSR